ncbi:hypothetical protein JOC45_003620 [Gordonia hydrophobica]|nr:hypothetical protein [Gordonia hydrophobica]
MVERDLVAVAQGVSDDRWWAFDDQMGVRNEPVTTDR